MSTKPSAYLSEEARLQAQRRMLAERYGLEMSDNSDDGASGDDGSGTSSDSTPEQPAPAPAPATAVQDEILQVPDNANGEVSSAQRPEPSRTVLEVLTGKSGGASSSSAPMMSPPLRSPVKSPVPESPTASGATWPGVALLSDTTDGPSVPASFTYVRSEERIAAALRRKNRIMPVAMYNSQLLPGHGRKIAVNDGVVTYVVGGHIRGIVRNSSILSLLKGHDSTVIDMEFASPHEKRLNEGGPFFSVLGSVAEDGFAYVWRLRRTDAPEGAAGERGTFEIVDRIPVTHPKSDHGGMYSRIAFRPRQGSVVADNGVGVALLLVDCDSPDVRAMELVKMDEKVLVREHMLAAANEIGNNDSVGVDVPVRACLWLNVNVTVVARGSAVMLWDFMGKTCIGRLPRGAASKVTSLHALDEQVLLVAVDDGRVLEIWYIGDGDRRLMQTFTVCAPDSSESFLGVVDVDPGREIIAVANAKGSYILVMHYNRTQRRIDAVTEVATSQPMLSFTLTRARKQPVSTSPGPAKEEGPEAYIDKIELWYVQPKGIHTMTLNRNHYTPTSKTDNFSTPSSSNASSTSLPPKSFALDPSIQSSAVLTMPIPSPPTNSSPKPPGIGLASRSFDPRKSPLSANPPPTEEISKPIVSILQRKPSPPARMPVAADRKAPEIKDTSSPLANKPKTEPPKPAAVPASSPPPTRAEDAEKVAEAMLQAAKRAIEYFEEKGRAREDIDANRAEKLVARVRENAEANLERAVNKAMKNCMGNIIIPNVSEVLSRVAPDEKTTGAGARQELYADAMAQSNLLAMYKAGCDEILEQVGGAVQRSMHDKCEALVQPAVRTIQAAADDITATVGALVNQLQAASLGSGIAPNGNNSEPDVRERVRGMLSEGRTDDAFLAVLDRQDLDLVTWLLAQFEPHSFFETYTLSQIASLSLAQQVGHRLNVDDPDALASVEWLRELMLVMAPNDEAIAGAVEETLLELAGKVTELQKEQALIERCPGIQKQLRQLGLVITSVASNAAS